MRTKRHGQAIANTTSSTAVRDMLALHTNAVLRTLLARQMGQFGPGSGMGERRNYEEACGYVTVLTFQDFYSAYDRGDLAARIVETYPDYTWIQNPEIFEKATTKEYTYFEKDWQEHCEINSPFAELRKLDIVAGIGTYGLLVLGVNDGGSLDSPLKEMEATASRRRTISYYRAYNQGEAKIVEWDTNKKSPRYGLPMMYEVTPGKSSDEDTVRVRPLKYDEKKQTADTTNPFQEPFKVHHTRCIHFADNALCGKVYGVPRLQRVFNRMTDLVKIVGGSAEMFWQGAFSGISFEMDPEAVIDDPTKQKIKLEIDNYVNKLQRTLLLQGVKANPMSPNIVSPKEHLDAQLTMASIATRIPKRILAGSEMGKLSSTQDAETWDTQVRTRRENIAAPGILKPYVEFCIRNGIVRKPSSGRFTMTWPKLNSVAVEDRGRSAEFFTTALDSYCTKALYHAMDFADYLVCVWGYEPTFAHELAAKFNVEKFEKIRKELIKSTKDKASTTAGSTQTTKTKTAKDKSRARATTNEGDE